MSMPTHSAPYPSWNSAFDFWRGWPGSAAPNTLVQPILPGWTLNINSQNSSAPQTEANVVARHSYGRQIGRMADALRTLVLAQQGGHAPEDGAFDDFLLMWDEVEQVKAESAKARLQQVVADLALLKTTCPDDYLRLRSDLQQALREHD
jgi:hypothetical protein